MADANDQRAPEVNTDELRTAFMDNLRSALREEVQTALGAQRAEEEKAEEEAASVRAEQEEKKRAEELEARLAAVEASQRAGFLPGAGQTTNERDQFNLGRVVRSLVTGDREDAPAEWEMSDQARDEMRAQGTAPDTSGGFIVPGQVYTDQIIPLLRPMLVARELGAVELAANTTPVEIPRETTSPTVDAVAENQANTDADVAFGMMRMEPHTAQSFIKASRRFLTMGAGADQFLRRRMSEEIAIEINRWALKGSGANNEPLGLLNTSGVNTPTATLPGNLNDSEMYSYLRDMELQVSNSDALMGSLGWAAPPVVISGLHQLKGGGSAENLEFARTVFSDAAETSLLGYQYRTTTQLSSATNATELIFGDWSRLVMARWGTVVIEASNTANDALQKRQTHIVAYMDIDIGVTQPTAFTVATTLPNTIN